MDVEGGELCLSELDLSGVASKFGREREAEIREREEGEEVGDESKEGSVRERISICFVNDFFGVEKAGVGWGKGAKIFDRSLGLHGEGCNALRSLAGREDGVTGDFDFVCMYSFATNLPIRILSSRPA